MSSIIPQIEYILEMSLEKKSFTIFILKVSFK